MQVLYPRCAGLDVHKKTVVACLMLTSDTAQVYKELRTFATTTAGLLALSDWLSSQHVTHVAMESSGVYWRPVFNLLEGLFIVILVNAQHMKAVPGRKTDAKDSEWIAELLRHGLLKASFIPPQPIRDLRDLLRYRKTLVYERSQEVNRLHKLLETANIKLASVASDILGKSGRRMLDCLLEGLSDPEALADLARGSLRGKIAQLREALDGRVDAHHRILLQQLLAHIDFLEQSMQTLLAAIESRLLPYEQAMQLLLSIPGIQRITAATIVGEIGVDMTRFPSAKHLASWAGVCPGNKQSGGKRLSGKATKGNPRLRAALAEVVWVISHMKDNYLSAQYHRLARRIGKSRAIVAVSHSLLVIIYHVLREQKPYRDLGSPYFETLDQQQQRSRAIQRLEALGYSVTLQARQQEVPA
ncbi:MAG TPA: IS110 family transposase [Ktedonobacteraceae bacterium]|jgi:transposase|nr:IS110 family transposase [Ktedonobacteraceae bacterium]